MSSLMQFRGQTGRRGVRLEFYRVTPCKRFSTPSPAVCGDPVELVTCSICGKEHPRLWRTWRKPAGMMGCWVVFCYNGVENVPDLSCPIAEFRIPKDAIPATDEDNGKMWHR